MNFWYKSSGRGEACVFFLESDIYRMWLLLIPQSWSSRAHTCRIFLLLPLPYPSILSSHLAQAQAQAKSNPGVVFI